MILVESCYVPRLDAFVLCWSDEPLAPTFEEAIVKVAEVIKGKVLIGHAIQNDFSVSSKMPLVLPSLC